MKDLGTILGVWAHPDDETWGCAGIMAMARRNGQRVVCVTATRGEAGKTADESRWPSKDLATIRTKELAAALKILGVEEHHWLDYADGKLADADVDTAVATIAAIIEDINPDTIFTFGHDGLTGHQDHKTICGWTCMAVAQAHSKATVYGVCEAREKYDAVGKACNERFDVYFKTNKPRTIPANEADLFVSLPPDILDVKLSAFSAQASQTAQYFTRADDREMITQLLASECFMRCQ